MPKNAVCYDECGQEVVVQYQDDATIDDVNEDYPEYRFRFWEAPRDYHAEARERLFSDTYDLY